MSVLDLIAALKVQDGTGTVSGYIADEVYGRGNGMIIDELWSRPPRERAALRHWPPDHSYVDTGAQGESITIDELIHDLLNSEIVRGGGRSGEGRP